MKKQLLLLTKFAVTVGLLVHIGRRIEWTELIHLFTLADGIFILAAILFSVLNLLLSNLRWHSLIRCTPRSSVRFWELMDLSVVGLFFNTCLPGGIAGDLIRGHRAKQYELKSREAYGSVIVDRLLGLIGLITVAVFGFTMNWTDTTGFRWQFPLFCVNIVGVVSYFSLVNPTVSNWVLRRFNPKNDLIEKGLRLYKTVASYPSSGHYWVSLIATLLTGGLLVATMFCLSQAFGSAIPYGVLLWLVPTVGILSTIPISLNGWGIREAGYIFFLELVGVSTTHALALSMSFGALALLLGGLGGLWYGFSTLFPQFLHPVRDLPPSQV